LTLLDHGAADDDDRRLVGAAARGGRPLCARCNSDHDD
jgi:hypothetical protein